MPWVTFIAWQRYAQKLSIERANAQKRADAGLGPRPQAPDSDEWAAHQARLKAAGGDPHE